MALIKTTTNKQTRTVLIARKKYHKKRYKLQLAPTLTRQMIFVIILYRSTSTILK